MMNSITFFYVTLNFQPVICVNCQDIMLQPVLTNLVHNRSPQLRSTVGKGLVITKTLNRKHSKHYLQQCCHILFAPHKPLPTMYKSTLHLPETTTIPIFATATITQESATIRSAISNTHALNATAPDTLASSASLPPVPVFAP